MQNQGLKQKDMRRIFEVLSLMRCIEIDKVKRNGMSFS